MYKDVIGQEGQTMKYEETILAGVFRVSGLDSQSWMHPDFANPPIEGHCEDAPALSLQQQVALPDPSENTAPSESNLPHLLGKKGLYYEPDGCGGVRWVYPERSGTCGDLII